MVDIALKLDEELRGIKQELRSIREGISGTEKPPEEEPPGFDVGGFLSSFEK